MLFLFGLLFIFRIIYYIETGHSNPLLAYYLALYIMVTLTSLVFRSSLSRMQRKLREPILDWFLFTYISLIYFHLIAISVLESGIIVDLTAYAVATFAVAFVYYSHTTRFIALLTSGVIFYIALYSLFWNKDFDVMITLNFVFICVAATYIFHSRERTRQKIHNVSQELLLTNARLQEESIRDPLTGLYNRRFLTDALEKERSRQNRLKRPFCVILCDIDHFKSINDTLGHPEGDRVLKLFAETLCSISRSNDFVSRYGGEEFMIVLPDYELKDAQNAAERIRQSVEQTNFTNDERTLTASFGSAEYNEGESIDDLLKRADEKLYQAKAAGRNCCK